MRSRLLTLAMICLPVAGCTRGTIDSSAVPTAPSLQAIRLTITPFGGGSIRVGETAEVVTSGGLRSTAVVGAFAEFNNGSSGYVDATWSSSDDSIVAVVNNVLVPRKQGIATLTASFDGRVDTEQFLVDGAFFGRWSGTYVVEQCDADQRAMFELLCRGSGGRAALAPIGAVVPLELEVTEAGGDDIRGRVSVGLASGVLSGKNRGGGYFQLDGEISTAGYVIRIVEWTVGAANDQMAGVLSFEVKVDGVSGTGGVGARLANMTRQ